ncbi:type I-E CRISPR-associated protein Cas7/Cse4/CasC [Actinorhabdospora filicis]|uniref:Type I-E CRISPR-associated protein Cas7/Cse4/CasC n=1 Tax=Actinorhabdospora filicis TaxID=1785913 RepID=A0A9W6SKS0_9ACTN|nr:type I-E CRISPR-associated protein Cas7/Cse4/CasC [Actinorhabdospora filicis]GLZ77715.1 type I-E CRISPR-associated protein Cas7/Cse4/CasC [Actinorhabdospora filicis]
MIRTIVDFHVLQTVPPSNLNRDDNGSPKTAVYGGKRRARVSSQAWKRAIRDAFGVLLDRDALGHRTKQVVEVLAARITAVAKDLEHVAAELAAETLTAADITVKPPKGKDKAIAEAGYLVFLSNRQYDRLAAAAVEAHRADRKPDKKTVRSIVDSTHSVDIALFGRMIADSPDYNVDAACQVAHALSVHAVDNEYDYYTAVDDAKKAKEETGAGMIGTIEFNSATLYRYAAVDVDLLRANLGDDDATVAAVAAFARAFVTSMPSGKMTTFGNRTLPDLVAVRVRRTQPVNLVGAFESAVRPSDTGRVADAVTALGDYTGAVETQFEEQPDAAWACSVGEKVPPVLGERVTIGALVDGLARLVHGRLQG